MSELWTECPNLGHTNLSNSSFRSSSGSGDYSALTDPNEYVAFNVHFYNTCRSCFFLNDVFLGGTLPFGNFWQALQ